MTVFYRFKSQQDFESIVRSPLSELTYKGVLVSVIGKIPDGGSEPALDVDGTPSLATGTEVKANGSLYKKGDQLMQPTFIEGWHVNAYKAIEGWEDMSVEVQSPMRVFG